MANVILGLLLLAPQSFYDLIKGFEAGVGLFYSASSGSIKRALDGLLARGAIEVASVEAGGRGRKVYRATDTGRAEFQAWMGSEPTGSDFETAALSRLYFLGLLDADDRVPVLRGITARIESDLAELTALDARLDTQAVPPEHRDTAFHQRATLAFGIASNRFALAWFGEHIERSEPTDG
ncbi:PadR family transcriptional regulator [Phytomonospora sp. NPDC050363]|uniref:PadR family transcriptional regulator n=1 Tax=Phytomonospora sp. NPDC050363 TaxID=3155642 RepID=UPI003409E822